MPPSSMSADDLDPVPAEPTEVPPDAAPSDPGPSGTGLTSNEAPDRDTPAWEGAEPDSSVGLVDPRHEIPNPVGL